MSHPADPPDLDAVRQIVTRAARHGVELDTTTNHERRALVLKHPDLAARLRQPPLALAHPEQWTGYIAPARLATGARNDSPCRTQAAAIYAEALKREQTHS